MLTDPVGDEDAELEVDEAETDELDDELTGGGTTRIAFGITLVQSVSWLILLTPKRLRRVYALA